MEDNSFICKICGEIDSPDNWMMNLEEGLCFDCSFWTQAKEAYILGHKIVIDGNMYQIGDEESRGFRGRQVTVRSLLTNKTFTSTNLWFNGKIPNHFRPYLIDNARFI